MIEDEDVRDATPTMGYYAGLEYLNGFRKVLYWSKTKMLNHANRYSKAFDKDTYAKLIDGEISPNDYTVSSYWYKDFDGMAMKTMLRQLISKWGIMSTEMQTAYQYDEGTPIVKDSEFVGVDYVDNDGAEENAAFKEQIKQEAEKQEEIPVAPSPVRPVQAEPAQPARRGRPPKRDDAPPAVKQEPELDLDEPPIPDEPVFAIYGGFPDDDDPLL